MIKIQVKVLAAVPACAGPGFAAFIAQNYVQTLRARAGYTAKLLLAVELLW